MTVRGANTVMEAVELLDMPLEDRKPADALKASVSPGTIVGPMLKNILSLALFSHTHSARLPRETT